MDLQRKNYMLAEVAGKIHVCRNADQPLGRVVELITSAYVYHIVLQHKVAAKALPLQHEDWTTAATKFEDYSLRNNVKTQCL